MHHHKYPINLCGSFNDYYIRQVKQLLSSFPKCSCKADPKKAPRNTFLLGSPTLGKFRKRRRKKKRTGQALILVVFTTISLTFYAKIHSPLTFDCITNKNAHYQTWSTEFAFSRNRETAMSRLTPRLL